MEHFTEIYQRGESSLEPAFWNPHEYESLLKTLGLTELDQCSSEAQSSPTPVAEQLNASSPELMPHELTQLQNLLSDHPQAAEELFDEACEMELDSEDGEEVPYDENGRYMGWTPEDNVNFANLLTKMLNDYPVAVTGERVKWREITKRYNFESHQNRSKMQLYSHYRYLFGRHRSPSYLKAEEEVLLALDEMGVEPRCMPPFLQTERSEDILGAKLKRLKASGKAKAEKRSAEANFRKKIRDIMLRTGGLDAIKTNKVPKVAIQLVRRLIATNSHLKKKYNVLKRPGRPPKQTNVVPVTQKLKTLFQPFLYVTRRRKRTTCYPGDARKYGMNLFCLNRLLGCPLELRKMPSDYEETVKAGFDESDYPQFQVLRELMRTHSQEIPPSGISTLPAELQGLADLQQQAHLEDRKHYAKSEHPPTESTLPPTLYTLTGLRGLLSYRETLKAIVEENDYTPGTSPGAKFGDQEADKTLLKLMLSMFKSAWELSRLPQEPVDNSDGDSDSDEEVCFTKQAPVEQLVHSQEEETLFDQILSEGSSNVSLATDRADGSQIDWSFTEEVTEELMQAFTAAELSSTIPNTLYYQNETIQDIFAY